jgi:hypothetical protein
MGSSFYSRWLIPRETSLVIWGSEGEGPRFKASIVKVSFPFTDYCQKDSPKRRRYSTGWHLFARQGKIKLKGCAAVVSTSQYQ